MPGMAPPRKRPAQDQDPAPTGDPGEVRVVAQAHVLGYRPGDQALLPRTAEVEAYLVGGHLREVPDALVGTTAPQGQEDAPEAPPHTPQGPQEQAQAQDAPDSAPEE